MNRLKKLWTTRQKFENNCRKCPKFGEGLRINTLLFFEVVREDDVSHQKMYDNLNCKGENFQSGSVIKFLFSFIPSGKKICI